MLYVKSEFEDVIMTEQNSVITLVARPEKGLSADLFAKETRDIPSLEMGQVLVKQTHLSLDPAMVGWMSADTESYLPPVPLGDVMRSNGYGVVLESNDPDLKPGDHVMGMLGWQSHPVVKAKELNKLDPNLPPEMVLSVFAIPGLTATLGLFDYGKPKAGETLVVTGAAGSVGSMVGQLAKAEGMRVIGVAGSEEKCQWLMELGFDGAINYKTDDLEAKLEELTPNGIDVFFENTGGPIQPMIFDRMNAFGRIVVCGLIADYTAKAPAPGPSWINVVKKRLSIQGFVVPDHLHRAPEILATLTPYVQAGKIQYRSHVLEGLDSAMTGLTLLFTGENQGKLIVKL